MKKPLSALPFNKRRGANGQILHTAAVERFWAKVNKNGPVHPVLKTRCWLWTASVGRGYGQFSDNDGARIKAHTFSWELANGPLPEGEGYHGNCVLHRCDNPPCVNPGHLFIGTVADNNRDMVLKGRIRNQHMGQTHCKRGHEFTPGNTIKSPNGKRQCRICKRMTDGARWSK